MSEALDIEPIRQRARTNDYSPLCREHVEALIAEVERLRAVLRSRGANEEPPVGKPKTESNNTDSHPLEAATPCAICQERPGVQLWCEECSMDAARRYVNAHLPPADELLAALRGVGTPPTERLLKLASTFDDALGRCALYGNADQVRETWHTLKFALIDAHKELAGTPQEKESAIKKESDHGTGLDMSALRSEDRDAQHRAERSGESADVSAVHPADHRREHADGDSGHDQEVVPLGTPHQEEKAPT